MCTCVVLVLYIHTDAWLNTGSWLIWRTSHEAPLRRSPGMYIAERILLRCTETTEAYVSMPYMPGTWVHVQYEISQLQLGVWDDRYSRLITYINPHPVPFTILCFDTEPFKKAFSSKFPLVPAKHNQQIWVPTPLIGLRRLQGQWSAAWGSCKLACILPKMWQRTFANVVSQVSRSSRRQKFR